MNDSFKTPLGCATTARRCLHPERAKEFLAGLCLAIVPLLSCISCSSIDHFETANYRTSPQIINVSSYDPKERQRSGSRYTVDDVSNLARNGAHGLIARTSKGTAPDTKAPRFLKAADRAGMMLGAYHFVLPNSSPVTQADRFVDRVRDMARAQGFRNSQILLVGDFDAKTSAVNMARFIERIRQRTGKLPVVYLENSDNLKTQLRTADPRTKAIIRACPYWMALYGHVDNGKSRYSANRPLTPGVLLDIYDTWDTWALWQYGGVEWDRKRGRSNPKHYSFGAFRSPRYFGNLDRPTERNVFNGTTKELRAWWARSAWSWK